MKMKPTDTNALLVRGDCLNEKALPNESCNLIVTSPPYNVGMPYTGNGAKDLLGLSDYERFTRRWMRNCLRWTAHTGRMCVNVSLDTSKPEKTPLAAMTTQIAIAVGWKYHATIIWNEGNISKGTAWGSWLSASAPHVIAPVEVVLVFYKDEWRRAVKGESDITKEEFKDWIRGRWTFNGESAKRIGHAAPFPRELPKRCIKLFSFKNDVVADPFAGSGTTLIEALENGRRGWGIELEKRYAELARDRVEKECGVSMKPIPRCKGAGFYAV